MESNLPCEDFSIFFFSLFNHFFRWFATMLTPASDGDSLKTIIHSTFSLKPYMFLCACKRKHKKRRLRHAFAYTFYSNETFPIHLCPIGIHTIFYQLICRHTFFGLLLMMPLNLYSVFPESRCSLFTAHTKSCLAFAHRLWVSVLCELLLNMQNAAAKLMHAPSVPTAMEVVVVLL